jgi:hypothetical protein
VLPWVCSVLMVTLGVSGSARAQLAVIASGTAQYEYNSNVFDLSRGQPLPLGFSGTGFGDSSFTESGRVDSSYQLGAQRFFATIEGSDAQYDRFSNLNHTAYLFDGAWDWKAADIWDGIIDVSRARSMVSFFNLLGPERVIQTDQRETGKAGLQFTPDWRAEVTGLTHKTDQPQEDAPNLSLSESSGEAAFKYLGVAGVAAGLNATYLTGKFDGSNELFEAPSYVQRSTGLTVTDDISGLSMLRADVGYTRRSSANASDNVSGVTGEFDYKRTLTGKTSAEFSVSRQINVFLTNTGSEIDSIATLIVDWQATYKIGVVVGYNYTYRQLPNEGDAPLGSNRVDQLQFAQLAMTYQPFPWLILKPYFNYQDRTSQHFTAGNFNSSSAGLLFTVQWQEGTLAQRAAID